MGILKNTEKLAVDANPILSAIIGGSARAVFLAAKETIFYTTSFNFKRVEKYIPVLSSKRKIPLEGLYMALSLLPVTVCDMEFYKNKMAQAKRMLVKRCPEDAHLLALSLKLDCPVWSNDRDFEGLGIKVYSTWAEIMRGRFCGPFLLL